MPLAGDIHWLRLGALCVGLFLVFAGAGICLGFGLSVDERTADAWSIGLIPAMSGLGLLVFHRLSASSTDTREPGRSA
jgi:hypothetical protein